MMVVIGVAELSWKWLQLSVLCHGAAGCGGDGHGRWGVVFQCWWVLHLDTYIEIIYNGK